MIIFAALFQNAVIMSKKRVLFVTQEMKPYTNLSEISVILNQLAPYVYNKNYEVRVLMPKYGLINERRHRLHEVVRLSGMNIIVDDDDFPLIIKVASLPGSRMQVYFLDSEDFFKRKFMFDDSNGKAFEDNADRMVFFCKGVMETVKKFGWSPDIIHCHGWMTGLIPLYLDKIYRNDPIFEHSKLIYSVYGDSYASTFPDSFVDKALINDLERDDLNEYVKSGKVRLIAGAVRYADGVIKGSETMDEGVIEAINETGVSSIDHDKENFLPQYLEYYKSFLQDA